MALAATLLLVTTLFAIRFAAEMLTTSLWNDELYSIINFSGRGPLATITEYIPNNHILYNFLNAIGPERTSFGPARARALAHVSIAALGCLFLAHFARRRQFVFGVLALQPIIGNYEFLDLCLQARGYGMTALLSGASSLVYFRLQCDQPTARLLAVFALLNALGIATVPTFVFWSVPLFVLLFVRHRSARVAIAAMGSAAATLVIHIGVLPAMLDNALGYGEQWGHQFARVSAMYDSVRIYFVGSPERASDAVLTWLGLVVVLLAIRVATNNPGAPDLYLLVSVLAAFAICLTLETPLVRTTAFLAVPLSLGIFTMLARVTDHDLSDFPRARLLVLQGLLVLFLLRDVRKLLIFDFLPIESWRGTASFIADYLPDDTPISASVAPDYLAGHIPGRRIAQYRPDQLVNNPDLVVIDSAMVPSDPRVKFAAVRLDRTVVIRIPQRREGHQSVFLPIPGEHGIHISDAATSHLLTDAKLSSCTPGSRMGAAVSLTFDGSVQTRSLFLAVATEKPQTLSPSLISIEDVVSTGICGEFRVEVFDRFFAVRVPDCRLKSVTLRVAPADADLGLCEVWSFPARIESSPVPH